MLYLGIIFRLFLGVGLMWFFTTEKGAFTWDFLIYGIMIYSLASYYAMYLRHNREQKAHEHAVKGYHWEAASFGALLIEYFVIPIIVLSVVAGIVEAIISVIPNETTRDIITTVGVGIFILYPVVTDIKRVAEDIRYRRNQKALDKIQEHTTHELNDGDL